MGRKIIIAAVAAAVVAGGLGASSAAGAATPKSQLKCFSEGPLGVCETVGNTGAHLVADGASGSAAGVYLTAKRTNARPIGSVSFSFDWEGAISGGAPRFSLPIDVDGDGTRDTYAFIDAANCGGVSGGSGTVSTANSACLVYVTGYEQPWANWAALVADNPTWTTAKNAQPFVIADWDADVLVTNVQFNA